MTLSPSRADAVGAAAFVVTVTMTALGCVLALASYAGVLKWG